jgi:thiamine pyrophosphate-dependent acetolactate synthase large subunit-like protein
VWILKPPNFGEVAVAMGAYGATVDKAENVGDALTEAHQSVVRPCCSLKWTVPNWRRLFRKDALNLPVR